MERIVVSLGGSMIIPNEVDLSFLKAFKNIVEEVDCQFILICGGGSTARVYANAGKEVGMDHAMLDWLGISATAINAKFVQFYFDGMVEKEIPLTPIEHIDFKEKVLVGQGWKPGWSTDYVAVQFAKTYGVKRVVNISNVKKVFTADPRVEKDAQPLDSLSWEDYLQIVGEEWVPSMSSPFDPIASKLAKEEGMKVSVVSGEDLENVRKCILGEGFDGTIIG